MFPPALNVVLHFTDPLTADSDTKLLAQAVAHPALTSFQQAQFVLLLLAPGAVLLGTLVWRGARRLALWGSGILAVAILAGTSTLFLAPALTAAASSGHPNRWLPLLASNERSFFFDDVPILFFAGQLVGFVLLGAALVRSRAVARWVGWTVIGSAVCNVVGHLFDSNPVVIVAWAALAAAMLPCAVAIGNLSRVVNSERVVAGAPVGAR